MTQACPESVKALSNQLGIPGRFEWVRVDLLDADPAYQREVNTKRGRQVSTKIALDFRWQRFGVLHVAPGSGEGENRRYWVLDGLHRLEGARAHGGIPMVPCWIDDAASVADRAEIFLAINRDRVSMHPYAVHRALIVAGDSAAAAVESVCKLTGVSVPLYPVPRNLLKPGQTLALATLKAVILRYGEKPVIRALRLMAEAWKDRSGEIRALSIKGVSRLIASYDPISDEALIDRLRAEPMDKREALLRGSQVVAGQAPDVLLARHLAAEIGAALVRSAPPAIKMEKPNQIRLGKSKRDRMGRAPGDPGAVRGQMYPGSAAGKPNRRFDHADTDPSKVIPLAADHPALIEKRTLFPSTVVNAADSPKLLISGANQRKLGDKITKGEWRGMPLFALTLEERKTCPMTCHHWGDCYGNNMPFGRRHRIDDTFFDKLWAELSALQTKHPKGFVIRLHVLGDFPTVEYVWRWKHYLAKFPALRIFGYTAWQPTTNIGFAIEKLRNDCWERFAIRFSSPESHPGGATTITRRASGEIDEGIVCPAQTHDDVCCGSCGLCWAPAAKDKTIVFMAHGRLGRPAMEIKEAPATAVKPRPVFLRRPKGTTVEDMKMRIVAAVNKLGKSATYGAIARELGFQLSRVSPEIVHLLDERTLRQVETGGQKTRYLTVVGSADDPDREQANDGALNGALSVCRQDGDFIERTANGIWRVNSRETLDRAGMIARGARIAAKRKILGIGA